MNSSIVDISPDDVALKGDPGTYGENRKADKAWKQLCDAGQAEPEHVLARQLSFDVDCRSNFSDTCREANISPEVMVTFLRNEKNYSPRDAFHAFFTRGIDIATRAMLTAGYSEQEIETAYVESFKGSLIEAGVTDGVEQLQQQVRDAIQSASKQ